MIRQDGSDVLIKVRVQPGASRSEVVGPYGDELKIRVAAPPVDGRANESLIEFVAETVGVERRRVVIERGATGRSKLVRVRGATLEDVAAKLYI